MSSLVVNGDTMKLIDIIRYLKGYVEFTINGGFKERFINLCRYEGIYIWNITSEADIIRACVSVRSFQRIRRMVRESGVTIHIEKKKGIPLLLKKYRHRAVLLSGILFIAAFYIIMNQFIWFIEVEGTQKISHEEIINIMKNYGVKIGSLSSGVDEIYAGRYAVNHFSGRLLWVSVNINGSKAVIEVRDYIDEHEDTTYGEPCNIVADFDGTLLSIETINGDKAAKPGNAVKKGDLLISGVIQNRDKSASYLEARGKITAHHNLQFTRSYNRIRNCKKYTDSEEFFRVNFLGLTSPLPFCRSNTVFSLSENAILNGTELPFGIIREIKADIHEDKSEFKLIYALDAYLIEFYKSFANTNIIENEFNIKASVKGYTITSDISCIDFIGVKSKIYVEE